MFSTTTARILPSRRAHSSIATAPLSRKYFKSNKVSYEIDPAITRRGCTLFTSNCAFSAQGSRTSISKNAFLKEVLTTKFSSRSDHTIDSKACVYNKFLYINRLLHRPRALKSRCQAKSAHIRQSRPNSGPVFWGKVLDLF